MNPSLPPSPTPDPASTIGALAPEQFFYLRSRGIPEAEARTKLVRAFLAEAIDPIAHEGARAAMEAAIAARWREQVG